MGAADLQAAPSKTAVLLMLAAASPYAALAQTPFEPLASDERQQEIVAQIQAIQSQDGSNSAQLIAPYTELAQLYEQSGAPAFAVAAVERALEIIRVNLGLHSLDQAGLIRQAIRIEEAEGNLAAAWYHEQELLTLAKRNPEELRTVPILREIAAKRLDLLDQWLAGEYPEQIALGDYCGLIGQIYVCEKWVAAAKVLADAQTHYADAIEVLLRNELYSSDDLRALEMELVRTCDLTREEEALAGKHPATVDFTERDEATGTRRDLIATRLAALLPRDSSVEPAGQDESQELPTESIRSMSCYRFGRLSLGRLYDYEVASSAPLEAQVNAVIRIADWDLLYSRNKSALEGYELAYTAFKESAVPQASIDDLFAPQLPVVLPTFLPNPLASPETQESLGYIDVAFEITRYGESRGIEILDTANVTDDLEKQVVALIRGNRFRPRLTERGFASSPVMIRYYF